MHVHLCNILKDEVDVVIVTEELANNLVIASSDDEDLLADASVKDFCTEFDGGGDTRYQDIVSTVTIGLP